MVTCQNRILVPVTSLDPIPYFTWTHFWSTSLGLTWVTRSLQRHLHLSKYTWRVFRFTWTPKRLLHLLGVTCQTGFFEFFGRQNDWCFVTISPAAQLGRRRNFFQNFSARACGWTQRWTKSALKKSQFFNIFETKCMCHMSNLTSLTWSRNSAYFTWPNFAYFSLGLLEWRCLWFFHFTLGS